MAEEKIKHGGIPSELIDIIAGLPPEQLGRVIANLVIASRSQSQDYEDNLFMTPVTEGMYGFHPGTAYFIKSEIEKLEHSLKAHIEEKLSAQLNKFFVINGVMMTIAITVALAAFAGITKLILTPPSAATKAAASLTELFVSFLP